jgi:hypothetical protein
MGQLKQQRPVLLIAAVISRYDEAFQWSLKNMTEKWGPIALKSPEFDFSETSFYTREMGTDLRKQLIAFERLIDPVELAGTKVQSNQWEQQYAESSDHPEIRPLNIDPGYITEAKLVLATTKNRDHRIYLQQGIFAEITLFYQGNRWQKSRWTYPDYQRADFQEFFTNCRDWLRKRYQEVG